MKKISINATRILCFIFCSFFVLSFFTLPDKATATLALPITENFETMKTSGVDADLPDNWNTTKVTAIQWSRRGNPNDSTGSDITTTVSPHAGSWMTKADVNSGQPGNSDRLFTIDSFSFPAAGSCEFSFWMYHYPDLFTDTDGSAYGTPGAVYGAADSIQPQISIDGGTSWTNIATDTEIKRVNGTTTGWYQYTFSLSSSVYGGNNVMVGLLAYADGGYNIYVDDISIYSTTPTNLTATAGNETVSLNWNSVTGATGYKVYKSTTAGSGYSEVDTGVAKTGTSYTVNGLSNGTPYYFVVTATTVVSAESAYSVYASATPLSTVPDPPTGLTATEGSGQVTLSWDSVTGATSYQVYKSTTSGAGYSEVDAGVTKTGTSYTITGLSNSVEYYFVVTVTTAGGTSPYSTEVTAMSSVPSAPTNLTATTGDGQVTLNWDSVIGATSYKVYQSTTQGGAYTEVDSSTSKTGTSYTVTGLTNNIPYYFVVKARRSIDSSNSNEICCKPLQAEMPAGSGTSADPYIIDAPYDLLWMSANIATVKADFFKQIADLEMTGVELTPIGNSTNGFSGTYDGCGRNISNLTINSNLLIVGLFGIISDGGTVKNLTLTNANVKCINTSSSQVGGIAGSASGTIESCYVGGIIESVAQASAGGLLGTFSVGTIKDCFSTVTVTGNTSNSSIGGIVGDINNPPGYTSSVQNCYFAGTLTGVASNLGGITGLTFGTISIADNHFLNTAATNGIGSPASDSGASPATDADLKQQFTNWDYSNVWYLNTGNEYPVLRAPTPYASDIVITVNPEGTDDTITVSGRAAGDIVKIYAASTGGTPTATTTVAAGPTSETVNIGKLNAGDGSVYVSITSSLRPESGRTQKGIPSAPTDVTATAGDHQATVSFTAPASNGGSAITGYTVISNPAGGTDSNAGSTSLSHVITGLTNGTVYTFTVTASNSVGTSAASTASIGVTPVGVPGLPTDVTATAGDQQATVSFTAPASNGGSAITGYTVISNPAGGTDSNAGSTSLSHVITGLTNGAAYTFTVTATNGVGTSAASTASAGITPAAAPGSPTGVTAIAGDQQATVSFTAPASNGGSAITGYTVISNPAGGTDSNAGSTSLSHVITGLTNGTAYTFTVTATNGAGTSAASTASIGVTPFAINHAPTAKSPVPTQVITGTGTTSFVASDVARDDDAGDTLSITSIITDPNAAIATAVLNSGTVTVTGVVYGATTLEVEISDGALTVDVTVPITVTTTAPTNHAPTAKSPVPTQAITGTGIRSFSAADVAQDEDGDTLTITSIVTDPNAVTATAALNSGTVTVTGVVYGTTTMVVEVSDGALTADVTVPITVSADTPIQNSTISPTTATFDKKTSAQADVPVAMTPNGNTLISIANGAVTLVKDADYTVAGTTVTIFKAYMASQTTGTITLTFNFSQGNPQTLVISVSDSTSSGDGGGSNNPPQTPTTIENSLIPSSQVNTNADKEVSNSLAASGEATIVLGTATIGDKAQLTPAVVETLSKNDKSLTVARSGVEIMFSPGSLMTPEMNAALPDLTAIVEIGIKEVSAQEKAQILTQSKLGESTGLFEVGGKMFDLSAQITKKVSSQQVGTKIMNFSEPVAVTIDLSGLTLTAEVIATLTGVRYEKAADGSINAVKLGGSYDRVTNTFTFYTDRFSLYGVLSAEEIKKISLKLGEKKLYVNGEQRTMDVIPEVVNNRTLVPIRFIAEAMGASVTWDKVSSTAGIVLKGKKIYIKIGEKLPGMDTSPMIINNRTFVPLRFVAEALGAQVLWFNSTQNIQITQ